MNGTGGNKTYAAVRFSVAGDVRYLSHQDTVRAWQRAWVRSGLPLVWTQGYNPRPRLRVPLPRNVGMAGERELAVVEMGERVEEGMLGDRLGRELPRGMKLEQVQVVEGKVDVNCREARYRVALGDGVNLEVVEERLGTFLAAERWPVRRERRGRHPERVVDLRSAVREAGLKGRGQGEDGGDTAVLEFTIEMGQEATARVDELLEALELTTEGAVREVVREGARYGGEPAEEKETKQEDLKGS